MIFSSLTASFSLQLAAIFASEEAAAGVGMFFVFFCCFSIIVIAINVFLFYIPLSKIFVKAGQPGWHAYIPLLNGCVIAHIVGRDWWWGLVPILQLLPFFELAKAFGKSDGYGIGIVLLSPVFIPMLGYGDARYQLEQKAPLI